MKLDLIRHMTNPALSTLKKNETVRASVVFIIIIIAAYAPVIFLDQSYNHSLPIPPEYLGYSGKPTPYEATIDPGGNQPLNFPLLKLERDSILTGELPLWNPYLANGQPFAASTDIYVFSPFNIGFLLPVDLWDFVFFSMIWVAGIFTFLFLRNIGLGFQSSLAGGTIFMLTGCLPWFLLLTNIPVLVFTPFILYSLEKIIQKPNAKHFVLASTAFSFGILGSHIESIILQIFFVSLYLCYRLAYPKISSYFKKRDDTIDNNPTKLVTQNSKRILSWSILSLLGGLGLSAFFVLPVLEYLKNGYISHTPAIGISYVHLVLIAVGFIPYVLGQIPSTPSPQLSPGVWGWLWGYVGVFALFFSIVGVSASIKIRNFNFHKYTPLFFMSISVFFIAKTFGIPPAIWLGKLPLFDLIAFRYYSLIIPFGFAISAAFGIEALSKVAMRIKTLSFISVVSISIILLVSIPVIPYIFTDWTKLLDFEHFNNIEKYFAFQIFTAIIFVVIAFLASVSISKNKLVISVVTLLIILELSVYVPVGIDPIWLIVKEILGILGSAVIVMLIIKPNKYTWRKEKKEQKFSILVGILIFVVIGNVLISEFSPSGMMERRDPFQNDPVTDFLQQNLNYSRTFSFDPLVPDFPAAYHISTVGTMTSFNTDQFHSFMHSFIDNNTLDTNLGWPEWSYFHGPSVSVEKFFDNKKYFDFLGVKYVLSGYYSPNSFTPGLPFLGQNYTKIQSSNNGVAQSFISPFDTIRGIEVALGTYGLKSHGNLILTVDSIPYEEKNHRQSIVNAENVNNTSFNEFKFNQPMENVKDKKLYFTLEYPETNANNLVAVFLFQNASNSLNLPANIDPFEIVKNNLHGIFYENNKPVEDKELVFSIIGPQQLENVYQFHDIGVYENKEAFPRAFLVNKFQVAETGNEIEFLQNNPQFDLRHNVVLEKQQSSELDNELNSSNVESNGNAKITSYSLNKVIIHTQSANASLLVLTDSYYPGWKSFVDGKETTIYLADGFVRAIFVPAGDHNIEFSYEPMSFRIGLIISFTTVIIMVSCLLYLKIKTRKLPETI
jgi:hypothetical protein